MEAKELEKPIIFYWKQEGEWQVKLVNRQEFMSLMEKVRDGFKDNNSISTKLCELIPDVIVIEIDKDRNTEKPESPTIECIDYDGSHAITIINHHKIIWSILNEYTK